MPRCRGASCSCTSRSSPRARNGWRATCVPTSLPSWRRPASISCSPATSTSTSARSRAACSRAAPVYPTSLPAAAAPRSSSTPSAQHPNFPFSVSVPHFLRVPRHTRSLEVRAVDADGHTIDRLRRQRGVDPGLPPAGLATPAPEEVSMLDAATWITLAAVAPPALCAALLVWLDRRAVRHPGRRWRPWRGASPSRGSWRRR